MSTSFTATLLGLIGILLAVRLVIRRPPFKILARPISRWAAVLAGIAIVGLVLHCTAMFDRGILDAIPGTGGYIQLVNRLGAPSKVLYAAPALLLLTGFRQQRRVVLAVLTVALVAVGVTMYDGGSVTTHLACIFVTAVLVSTTTTLLITEVQPQTAQSN